MSGPDLKQPARNAVVAILGSPDRSEGSLDDPRLYEENGIHYNEKWLYTHLSRDPAGTSMRVVYWKRYDFQGTVVRNSESEPWRTDTALIEAADERRFRLPPLDRSRNPPLQPTNSYRPVSEPAGTPLLGGEIEERS